MNNNDADKVNNEENSLLKYSSGTSYSSRSTPPASLTGLSQGGAAPVQFTSRRERRMSETSMISQVEPEEVKTPSSATLPSVTPPANSSSNSAAVPVPTITLPPVNPSAKRPRFKEYWGGTAMLMSLLVFLVAQVIFAFILVGYIVVTPDAMASMQAGNLDLEKLTINVPWLLMVANVTMYGAWLGSMWWVTKYRSGVQRGKKFWNAAKDNFRLNNFKYRDIGYGLGIAVVLIGFQTLVLDVLPNMFPSLKSIVEAANNTNQYAAMDDVSFYIVAFGMGAILAPIFEELFFRGFLLRGFTNHFSYDNSGRNLDTLEDELGDKVLSIKSMMVSYRAFTHKHRYVIAIIITSILFGLMHFQGSFLTCLVTGLLGLVFAITTIKLNRIYPAIFGHIFHNAIAMTIVALHR